MQNFYAIPTSYSVFIPYLIIIVNNSQRILHYVQKPELIFGSHYHFPVFLIRDIPSFSASGKRISPDTASPVARQIVPHNKIASPLGTFSVFSDHACHTFICSTVPSIPGPAAVPPGQIGHIHTARYFHPAPSIGAKLPPVEHRHPPAPISGSSYWQDLHPS